VAKSHSLFVVTPLSGFRLPARSRFGEGRGALHLGIFEQPAVNNFFSKLLVLSFQNEFKNGMGQIPQKEGKKRVFFI
jgi:hypothetical protein